MKKLGTIDISFKELRDGVYYYNLSIIAGSLNRTAILPRYDAFLGWIEIFGLPPQNEWVILRDLPDFTKSATLTVDGVDILETVKYERDAARKTHRLDTTRTSGEIKETCTWTQDYTDAPHNIQSRTTFDHPQGTYTASWQTAVLNDTSTLTPVELAFYQKVVVERGTPDIIIKKTFNAKGIPPPLYYSLLPVTEIIDLADSTGSLIELGYLKKDSPHKVDQVHGDWFKRFDIGEQIFHIIESNYSSCPVEVDGVETQVKNTYRKGLYQE